MSGFRVTIPLSVWPARRRRGNRRGEERGTMSIEIPMQPERYYVDEAKGHRDDDAPWERSPSLPGS